MEKIKVSKVQLPCNPGCRAPSLNIRQVEDVQAFSRGQSFDGSLHITLHHMIFRYTPPAPAGAPSTAKPPSEKQIYIAYPHIFYCCLRPSPSVSHYKPAIRIRCRDFKMFAFNFQDEKDARNVYDSIRGLSCKIGRLDRLLAFVYQPGSPESEVDGWKIYDARKEFKRLGISPKDSEKGWRISEINADYKVCRTERVCASLMLGSIPRRIRRSLPFLQRFPTASFAMRESTALASAYPPLCTATL